MARIEDADLSLFEFDLDLTFMVFFLNADEQIYGRFGGRDSTDADNRQSLAGLQYAMRAALDSHRSRNISPTLQERGISRTFRDLPAAVADTGCVHCHQVKETINFNLKETGQWKQELVWRYPPPDNLGLILAVDRGNVVEKIEPDSPAAELGLRPGDVVEELGGLPVHSFADAQFALDRAPTNGSLAIAWKRGDQLLTGNLSLPDRWRRTDISWRPSMMAMVATAPINGKDLTETERDEYGLARDQLAFWQQSRVTEPARSAGIRSGDLVSGFDGQTLKMDAYQFQNYVRANYASGDNVTVEVIRNGERLSVPMTLK